MGVQRPRSRSSHCSCVAAGNESADGRDCDAAELEEDTETTGCRCVQNAFVYM